MIFQVKNDFSVFLIICIGSCFSLFSPQSYRLRCLCPVGISKNLLSHRHPICSMYQSIYMYKNTLEYVLIHIYVNLNIYAYIHIYTQTFIYKYIYIYIHLHTHIYINLLLKITMLFTSSSR
jgi:hypothetical protein